MVWELLKIACTDRIVGISNRYLFWVKQLRLGARVFDQIQGSMPFDDFCGRFARCCAESTAVFDIWSQLLTCKSIVWCQCLSVFRASAANKSDSCASNAKLRARWWPCCIPATRANTRGKLSRRIHVDRCWMRRSDRRKIAEAA